MRACQRFPRGLVIAWGAFVALVAANGIGDRNSRASDAPARPSVDSSPVDLVLTADESRAITANQTANTICLVDLASGTILSEAPCG